MINGGGSCPSPAHPPWPRRSSVHPSIVTAGSTRRRSTAGALLAYKDGARVRLISRNAVDHTARFRELAAAIAKLRADVLVLDGEVAVFDKELVSRFPLLGDDDTGILCTPPI
jgi:folate-dependent phosphoribosylglycinamide formyltransferase PurN